MPRFSSTFRLGNSQATLDFVDVELERDKPLYLDPYALEIKNDDWSAACADQIKSFFTEVLSALRNNNMGRATHLLSNLHEPNETRFGVSKGEPKGRAIGPNKAMQIADALRSSRAFQTGLLSDVAEAELFIYGIGSDTISDLVTNVCRKNLCEYTLSQCQLHGIPVQNVTTLGPIWNTLQCDWESASHELPVYQNKPIVLVPKFSVRHGLVLNSQEFYNHHMIEFLRSEYLNAGGALVQILKNGTRRVTKVSVKDIHPFAKNDLFEFVQRHPQVLESYKNMKGAEGPLNDEDFTRIIQNSHFDEQIFARALIERLANIPSGRDAAEEYHSFAMGICTFAFYPKLGYPTKEAEIHNGRKRIDIRYTNTATEGFFHSILMHAGTRSNSVPFECKNYGKEIANPELDQLAGRFSPNRGRLGFLLCRNLDNRQAFTQRCRDNVMDDRGFIIVIEDTDLVEILKLIESGERGKIDHLLQRRFDEII